MFFTGPSPHKEKDRKFSIGLIRDGGRAKQRRGTGLRYLPWMNFLEGLLIGLRNNPVSSHQLTF